MVGGGGPIEKGPMSLSFLFFFWRSSLSWKENIENLETTSFNFFNPSLQGGFKNKKECGIEKLKWGSLIKITWEGLTP